EYWFHYFKILKKNGIPLFMISSIFRKDQIFFKWYGWLNRRILSFVTHFFVQNETSRALLADLGLNNVTVSGDTRFDRVHENATRPLQLELVKQFSGGKNVLIGGSTWPEDEALLAQLAATHPDWRVIIAPHEIHSDKIENIERSFPAAIRYSELAGITPEGAHERAAGKRVLIIDNIGMLSSLYQYGRVAFIGGGFGAGIHNTLEAAAFGLPVIFGPAYQKFQEAIDLITTGGGFSVRNYAELDDLFSILENEERLDQAAAAAALYVSQKTGATDIILEEVLKRVG
ncbi:MAG TPA: glycosyltransferase N-terminal domain-containing protein, partial [Sphingobacteriaceae bacterium]